MYNSQTVKDRINSTIKIRKTSATKVLGSCGFSPNVINQMSDKNGLSSFNLAKIADYLECSVDYLLGRTDNPYVSVEAYIGGDNNGVQAVKNGTVTINQNTEKQNEMEVELLKAFRTMNFKDKMEIMNIVLAKMKK